MALDELLAKQNATGKLITKTILAYNMSAVAKRTKGYIKTTLEAIKGHWEQFLENHIELECLTISYDDKKLAAVPYFSKGTYDEMAGKYTDFVAHLNDALLDIPTIAHSPKQELRLPSITLPTFLGTYDTWRSFHDLFVSLVHTNNSLSDVQKLHYLKSNVRSDAEHLLRHFQVTDANYSSAWNVLLERYNNNRVLVNTQLKLLCNQQAITHENSKSLKSLLDRTTECLFELEALGVSTKDWDPILIYILVQKLPAETHKMWEQHLNGSQQLPTFEQLKKFLETRFRTLEAIAETKLQKPPTNEHKVHTQRTHHVSIKTTCVLCGEPHLIHRCPQFIKMDTKTKQRLANSKRLCINCLSSEHTFNRCTSKYHCKHCGQKHHTLLHDHKPKASNEQVSSTGIGTRPPESNSLHGNGVQNNQADAAQQTGALAS